MTNRRNIEDKKREIIDKYNASADFYDKRYRKIQNSKFEEIFKNKVIKHRKILDLGCGSGLLINYFSKKGFSSFHYVGIDISKNMIRNFKNKLENKGEKEKKNYNILLADIENLPFRENSFNILISFTSLQNLENWKKGIIEGLKVVRQNSQIHISILKKKIKKKEVYNFLTHFLIDIKFIELNHIEDILVEGIIKMD